MKMYQCRRNRCTKKYTLACNRSRHERECSEGEMVVTIKAEVELICKNSWCGKKFVNMFTYNRHMTTCERKLPKIFTCLVCGKKWKKRSKLLRHQAIHRNKASQSPQHQEVEVSSSQDSMDIVSALPETLVTFSDFEDDD